ncbi:MAG: PAS domain-containing protein [Gemmatimonadetes bacterium]|nr:PAS domain-containing protein [Gemmatimonadota bacterium]
MNPRAWRLVTLASLGAALLAAIILGIGFLVAAESARSAFGAARPPAGDVHARLARAFLLAALLVIPTAALLGAWAGRRLARPFHRLHHAIMEAEGDPARALPASRSAEAAALADAAALAAVSAQRRQAATDAQRDALARIVNGASEGLLQVDLDGRVRFANPAACALLELPESAPGQSLAALVRNTELRRAVTDALRGEAVAGQEVLLGERRLLVSAEPLAAGAAGAAGAIISIADLTALRRREGVRRDFVANASHELRTPLTSIRGYAETLLQDDLPPELRQQFLDTLRANAERLQHIVDDLLDLSRIESGGWQPALQRVSIPEAVRAAWEPYRDRAERGQVRLVPPDGDVPALADPEGLRHVLGNLFDNALRYTPAGGTIRVTAEMVAADPGRVQLCVADTGAGIPRAALPRIFERFYRVDPARSRAEGGTGLGLAIVKHLVEAMSGGVHAESEPGHGTAIHIWLRTAS